MIDELINYAFAYSSLKSNNNEAVMAGDFKSSFSVNFMIFSELFIINHI